MLFLFFAIMMFGCTSQKTAQDSVSAQPAYPWETCSNQLQSHACNTQAFDVSGLVELYDHYKKPIVLDLSTMWCGYCQTAGREAQAIQDSYASDDLIYITVLIENFQGEPPEMEDLVSWNTEMGITTAPVWAASRDIIGQNPEEQWALTSWPTFYFIDRDMKVKGLLRGYSHERIIEGIDIIVSEE